MQKHARQAAAAAELAEPERADEALRVPDKKLDDEEASLAESLEDERNPSSRKSAKVEQGGMMPMTSCIGRIGRPMFRLINRPWKVCSLTHSSTALYVFRRVLCGVSW